ncbi:MAG: 5'-methylthioadenosine/adenosylhomocysteine nucleosidase [Acidimicrobiia bacterium]|nr:5'-methylthioadenosine/adenosylhomocysteine nucleosidase [Acidimicrobiia bacterium]
MVSPIGLLTALPQEHHAVEAILRSRVVDAGFTFGDIDGVAVCLGMTGIGKVNAAVSATQMCERTSPSVLVFTGVAGGLDPSLDIGDVVIGDTLIQHDAGVMTDGGIATYQAGHIPFFNPTVEFGFRPSDRLRDAARRVLSNVPPDVVAGRIVFGTILTGDQFLESDRERRRLWERFSAQAIEMEGAAVAQVASRYGLDHLAIRTLSDRAGQTSSVDFSEFLDRVAHQTVAVLRLLLPALAGAGSDRPAHEPEAETNAE